MLCPIVGSCYVHVRSGKSRIQVVGGGGYLRKQKLPESRGLWEGGIGADLGQEQGTCTLKWLAA